jgi:phytoene dehydrogenase-like protein
VTVAERVDVVVVGAGLAGLSAAYHLRQAGLDVVVCEAADTVGGRVRTDVVDGFRLDRGFQVLLPSYPAVRALPGLKSLRLQHFTRGVIAAGATEPLALVPPGRRPAGIPGAARFAARRVRDTAALALLSARDVAAPARVLRGLPCRETAAELSRTGLSERTLEDVFRPFLAGVFLDRDLVTSSRVFHLVWRSFLRGGGALPASGMGALPHLLASMLGPGTVRCGTPVSAITDRGVRLRSRRVVNAPAVVVATDGTTAAALVPGVPAPRWHSVTTYYYRLPAPPPPGTGSTLVVDGASGLLLNTAVISNVAPGYAPPGQALVAASVPERLDDDGLETTVRERLARLYDTDTRDWDLLATYAIPEALPVMGPDHPLRRSVRVGEGRYVCGDHRDTSSIQGALVSGRRAAAAVLDDLGSPA